MNESTFGLIHKFKQNYFANMEPLVSICCLTFNHEPYIRQCLEGFIMQKTNFKFEILIHDDASIDNTATIIREYEAKYAELIKPIYQKENQYSKGISISLLNQFPRAKGKYIALCEGDDYWTDPYKLQKQVDFLETNPDYVLAFHNRQVMDINGDIKNISLGEVEKSISRNRMISTFIPTLTMVFRNNIHEIYEKDFSDVFSGDVLIRSILSTKGSAYFFPFTGAVYRQHSGGIYTSKGIENRLKLSLDSRNCIQKKVAGINKSDMYYSKSIIANELFEYYLIEKKWKKCFAILPKLIFYIAASKRLSTLKYFLSILRNEAKNIFKLSKNIC